MVAEAICVSFDTAGTSTRAAVPVSSAENAPRQQVEPTAVPVPWRATCHSDGGSAECPVAGEWHVALETVAKLASTSTTVLSRSRGARILIDTAVDSVATRCSSFVDDEFRNIEQPADVLPRR